MVISENSEMVNINIVHSEQAKRGRYYYEIFYSNTFTIKGLVHIHTAYYSHLHI